MENLINKKEHLDEHLIDDELAGQAGLTWCGSDNEGNDEYIGTTGEWKKYERLETIKLNQ